MACILENSDLKEMGCLKQNCCFFDRALKLCVYIGITKRSHGRIERLNAAELKTEPAEAKKAVKKAVKRRIRKKEKIKK